MNSYKLDFVQDVFKKSRQNMIKDFLNESPDIFMPSYKYENSQQLLNISIEKYFVSWLGDHWSVFQNQLSENISDKDRQLLELEFSTAFMSLLSKWSFGISDKNKSINLGLALIEDMKSSLQGFQLMGDNADLNRNKLKTALEKNRVTFDRKIKKMENEL